VSLGLAEAAPCASCEAADTVAALVRAHYGLGPPAAAPPACDHDATSPADPAELSAFVDRMRLDFPPPTASPLTPSSPSPSPASDDLAEPEARPDGPVPGHPVDELVVRWAGLLGVDPARFVDDRRAFIEGRLGLGSALRPGDVLRAVLPFLQRRGLLITPLHRVVLVHGGLVGSHTVPVRLPGESLVVVPGDAGPLCAQYVLHEIGHVTEHAGWRRGPLPERFAFDAHRSEGIALLFERLARHDTWWADLGLSDLVDARVVEHLRIENEWTTVLAEVVTGDAAPAQGSWALPADELRRNAPLAGYWAALLDGAAWAARVDERLAERWGELWWRAEEPWEWMVTTNFDGTAL
jgi:hypothetical protein